VSYLVIARKWRPQTWDDVVAQDHVTATLKNAINHERLAHAYLFTGPRGVGKTSAARILAKALNCEQSAEGAPCNSCSSCTEIAEGRAVDVFEIDGASNRGIDEVRNLRENIRYTPAKGMYRIYIIDEVHMLTAPAFNALLKTLEEPPSHVVFVFATTEPHKVPATILSRCQRFDFRRIKPQDIIERLKLICKEEKIEIDDEALYLIARKADGSLRDSQSILDQIVSYTGEKITATHIVQCLGLIEQEIFFEVTDVLSEKDVSKGLQLVEKIVSGGYDLEEFLTGLSDHLRQLLIVRSTGSADLVEASEDNRKQYLETAQMFREEDVLRLIRIVLDTRMALKRAAHPRLPLELAMVRMIKLDQTVTIEDLLSRLERLGDGGIQPSATGSPTPPAPIPGNSGSESPSPPKKPPKDEQPKKPPSGLEKETDIDLDHVKLKWNTIIERVKHRKITVGSFLQEGVLLGMEGNTIELGFGLSNGFHIDAIMRSKDMIQEELREVLGWDLSFRCVKKDLPKREVVTPKKEKEDRLKDLGESDPVIKKIVDDFDAEIVD
jgi:DNA polymerase-3 subunit gamma/tau